MLGAQTICGKLACFVRGRRAQLWTLDHDNDMIEAIADGHCNVFGEDPLTGFLPEKCKFCRARGKL